MPLLQPILAALLLASAPAASPNLDRRPPIDECATDASFVAFRTQLREAVERQDRDFLLSAIADDILVNFGGDSTRRAFIETWGLAGTQASPLWAELGEVLQLGCARAEDGSFWAPSLGNQLSEEEDPFEVVVAVRPGASLRSAPDPQAPVVAELEWDVLTTGSDDGADEWIPVSMRDGRSGFVRSDDVRSPLDYRAGFEKRGGRWLMTAFVAGD